MKRTITLIAMLAMTMGLVALPAAAYDTPEYTALEQALTEAQAEVDRLEAELERLEDEISVAEAAVAVQRDVVNGLEADLLAGKADLAGAEAEVTRIEGIIAAFETTQTLKDGECNNRNGEKVACDAALDDLLGATTAVTQKQGEVLRLDGELATEDEELERLQRIVPALVKDKEATKDQLDEAIIVRDATQTALDAYVPPSAEAHPGCKGLNDAQTQVSRNGAKGKAPAVLEAVADKFGC